ncbi:hypothetical protein NKH77_43850 [Streptomyces sp. M19]
MAVELLDSSPVFAAEIAACGEALAEFVDWRVEDVLRGRPARRRWTASTSSSRCCSRSW